MTKNTIIFGVIGLVAGAALGFVTGYYARKKKDDEDLEYWRNQAEKKVEEEPDVTPAPEVKEEPKDEKKSELDDLAEKASRIVSPGPAKIAMPGKPGVDYAAYSKKVEELRYKAENEHPKDDDEEGSSDPAEEVKPEDFPQTYDERINQELVDVTKEFEVYKSKRKKPFYILSKGYDEDWPDIHYEEKQLWYLTVDDLLVDENGNYVNEEKCVGTDLRKFGWFINRNMTHTTVRNMEEEIDYKIDKQFTDYEDFFGKYAPDDTEEEDDEEIE